MTQEELETQVRRKKAYLSKLLTTDLETAAGDWKHVIGRNAFVLRWWEETIRVITITADRQKIQAGYSMSVHLTGEQRFFLTSASRRISVESTGKRRFGIGGSWTILIITQFACPASR